LRAVVAAKRNLRAVETENGPRDDSGSRGGTRKAGRWGTGRARHCRYYRTI